MSLSSGAVTKGYLKNLDTNEILKVQFNPYGRNFSRSVKYAEFQAPGMPIPEIQYTGGGSIDTNITLFFYARGLAVNPFRVAIDFVKKLLPPEDNQISLDGSVGIGKSFIKPPKVIYVLGTYIVKGVVTSANVFEEEHDEQGNPVMGTISLVLRKV